MLQQPNLIQGSEKNSVRRYHLNRGPRGKVLGSVSNTLKGPGQKKCSGVLREPRQHKGGRVQHGRGRGKTLRGPAHGALEGAGFSCQCCAKLMKRVLFLF